jgi:hypothetical protein
MMSRDPAVFPESMHETAIASAAGNLPSVDVQYGWGIRILKGPNYLNIALLGSSLLILLLLLWIIDGDQNCDSA